jgi:hypothetical protein
MLKIPLTQGKFAIVGPKDYAYLMQWKWCYHNTGYAVRTDYTNGKRTVRMHRVILERMGFKDFEECDHVNRDGIDNCRRNLRPAMCYQNVCNCGKRRTNTSSYIGVSWHKASKKWAAYISISGKQKHLGLFDDKEEATQVRDKAACKHHGKFAVLNKNPPRQRIS